MVRHVLASAVAVLATVAATPVAAASAGNSPPSQPLPAELSTGGMPCTSGAERTYVSERPLLSAVLRDPDQFSRVKAQFEISWSDAVGAKQFRTHTDESGKFSGSKFTWSAPSDVPVNTVMSWRVRAYDDEAWGPWSSENEQEGCEFVHDDQNPESATISSAEYPDDDTWHGGVGHVGHFTFDSPSVDVVAYRYSFVGGPNETVRAATPGDPVTISWVPDSAGPKNLQVQPVDRAGRATSPTSYEFLVLSGGAPVGSR